MKLGGCLLLGWSAIVGFLALRFFVSELRFRKRLRVAVPLAGADLPFDFQSLCRTAGVRRSVRLVESGAVAAPAVHGIFRPSVVLPSETRHQLSPAQLRWALLHELAHIRRHDLAVILFQRVVSWFFFFHPAVWIANRMIHQQREYACDDLAILQNNAQSADAGSAFMQILRSANHSGTRDVVALSVLGMGPRESCQNRLLRMLDADRTILIRPRWFSLCGLLLIATLTLPHFAAADQDSTAEDKISPTSTVAAQIEPETQAKPEAKSESPWRFGVQVNDQQGNPIANARVSFHPWKLPEIVNLRMGRQLEKVNPRLKYECDDQGRFSVDFAGRPEQLLVSITRDGYCSYSAEYWRGSKQAKQMPHHLTAVIDEAWTLGGQILDDAGKPLKDAAVAVSGEYKQSTGEYRSSLTELKTDA